VGWPFSRGERGVAPHNSATPLPPPLGKGAALSSVAAPPKPHGNLSRQGPLERWASARKWQPAKRSQKLLISIPRESAALRALKCRDAVLLRQRRPSRPALHAAPGAGAESELFQAGLPLIAIFSAYPRLVFF